MSSTAPFPIDSELVGVSIAYTNERFIADDIFPRIMVGKEEFKYWKYPKGQYFTIPDTKVGRRGQPNEVHLEAERVTDSTEDYGLDDTIPQKDIDNAPENHDPVAKSTEFLRNLILLDREKRVADKVTNASNYASGNKVQLSGTDQWSDHANSTPIDDIQTGIDAMIMRPNKMVIGNAAWSELKRHPEILKAVNRSSGDSGIATRQEVAEIFELDEIIVGESWYNTAKKGQTTSLQRVWGKHAVLFFEDPTADNNNGITFGFTAQFGDPVAGQEEDSDIGLDGGIRVRNGEKVKEVIVANDLGYLIEDAVA